MGGVRNGAAEEDWHGDLNPGAASMQAFGGPCGFGKSWDCSFRMLPFATWLRKQERFPGRKGMKGLLLGGHEKVSHGFGLTGDHGGDTANGARSLNH